MRLGGGSVAGFVCALLVAVTVAPLPATAHEEPHKESLSSDGHVPMDINYGLRPVGHDTLGGVEKGRYTDVWAEGGYAYVGTFQLPTCDGTGVYISDISDPANPETVGAIPSPEGTRVNDVKTIQIAGRDVLIHSLEPCADGGQGGISLYDVTDPEEPEALAEVFAGFPVHNLYPWTDAGSDRSYVIVVHNFAGRDVVIVDISEPASPRIVAEVGLPDWPQARDGQAGLGTMPLSFNHDVSVSHTGQDGYQAVVSYWDAGFVVLDVNDPTEPRFVAQSSYPATDPLSGASPSEGNGHAAVLAAGDADHIYAGDEDFTPHRFVFEISSGPDHGDQAVVEAAFTTPIVELPGRRMEGPTTYLGLACDPQAELPDAGTRTRVAVVARGACEFSTKAETALTNGYDGLVVFNDAANGDELITIDGSPVDLPGVFVGHSSGLAIFGAGSAAELSIGQTGEQIAASAVFDGWGYLHVLDRRSLEQVGSYAPGQVADPDYARDFGDLTMHNVEGDLRHAQRAYMSWYSLGMRAVELDASRSQRPPAADWDAARPPLRDYYGEGVREIGRFIAPGGSNFWGVHVTEIDGVRHILGSDRTTGLWIFRYDPTYCEAADGFSCQIRRPARHPAGVTPV